MPMTMDTMRPIADPSPPASRGLPASSSLAVAVGAKVEAAGDAQVGEAESRTMLAAATAAMSSGAMVDCAMADLTVLRFQLFL
jgi:hypothetical protein